MLINNGIGNSTQAGNTAKSPATQDNVEKKPSGTQSADSSPANASPANKVELSSEAHVLSQVAAVDDVDTTKVEALRKAIAEGSYQIDADAIAEKMLASDDLS